MTDMNLGTPTHWADDQLELNARALQIEGKSLATLMDAEPTGEVVTLSDGDPAVRYAGEVLGAPADEASRTRNIAALASDPHSVVVVFGYGAGHAVRELRSRAKKTVVVYEPCAGLLRAR